MNPDTSPRFTPHGSATQHGPSGIAPLTTAVRQRLQKVFEHAQRCFEKQDYDYANKLFTQCLVEDPVNLVYLQCFLGNLQKKYGDNHRGKRLGGLKLKSQRSSLVKATGKGDWAAAFQAACAALAINPWDIATLLAVADAYEQLHCEECELYCLRWALTAEPKNIEVNRHAGRTLQRIGLFDQAIACWQRVKLALPEDEEARQSISRLSVEITIDQGGYDSRLLSESHVGGGESTTSIPQLSKNATPVDDRPLDQQFRIAIAENPTASENYLRLADLYLGAHQYEEAEKLLAEALNACGSGDLQLRSRIEDVQMRRAQHQVAIAEQRCQHDPSDEAKELAHRFRVQANQVELETYAARAERDPGNPRLKYELGLRLKRAGKVREAITVFQAAKGDSKRRATILVELGECFQHVEQYKLALSHYEQAIEAAEGPESEVYRKALYRAAVLSTGLKEIDRAERYLSTLAAVDYGYRDVAERLDKLAKLRDSK